MMDSTWTHNDYTDYMKHWPNVADYSLRDQTWQIRTQHQTGTYARGLLLLLWNQYTDPIEGKKCYNLYTKQKTKYQRQYKMHNFTLSYVRLAYTKHENFMHMIRWVTYMH